jgi:acetate CoA/acetoacetate CoA-transferase alpha subunit
MVENGKEVITVDSKRFILEKPLKADIACIGASVSDRAGNLYYKGTTQNFNPIMAMSADIVIAEVVDLVEIGSLLPEQIHTPAILVDYILIK